MRQEQVEAASYVAALAEELAEIAKRARLPVTGILLEMVKLELRGAIIEHKAKEIEIKLAASAP